MDNLRNYFERFLYLSNLVLSVSKIILIQQNTSGKLWITYAKCQMALGDRPGAERGLEKAKAFCKGDFNAIICELQVFTY